MTLSVSNLSANFKEVYYEALDSGEPNLVPSLFTQRLYARKSWLGRIWTIIIAICGIFCGGGAKLKCNRRKKILENIEKSFAKFRTEIRPIFERYKRLIGERSEGYSDNEPLFRNLRYQVDNWNTKTLPFLKLIQKNHRERIQRIFKEALSEPQKSVLFGENLYEDTKNYQALIDLETSRGELLPYVSLGKLALEKPLSRKEETDLQDWVTETENAGIKQRKLHRALKALVSNLKTFNTSPVTRRPSLAGLEISLLQKGLNLVLKEDPKHVAWRTTLKMGDAVRINGTRYELGQEVINSFRTGFNNNRVFLSRDFVDRVIVIGKNLGTLKIRKKSAEMGGGGGVNSPEWIDIDKEGKAGFQERMLKHISGIEWKSIGTEVAIEDRPFARPFVGLIKFLREINKTPKTLAYQHVFFDKEAILKTIKPSQLSEFNYALLERFAFQVSKKNLLIFHWIIDACELLVHPHARYFEDIVKSFERGDDTLDAQSIATLTEHSITTVSTVDAGKELQAKVKSLYDKIEKKIEKKYQVEDIDNLKRVVKVYIKTAYFESRARHFFYPKFKKNLMNRIATDMRLLPRGEQQDAVWNC